MQRRSEASIKPFTAMILGINVTESCGALAPVNSLLIICSFPGVVSQ